MLSVFNFMQFDQTFAFILLFIWTGGKREEVEEGGQIRATEEWP